MTETITDLEVLLQRKRGNITLGKAFDKLAKHITKEYEKKGYSTKESKYIGKATAGKVAREKGY